MGTKRNRTLYSVRLELIQKAREAALSAVQIFNNPNIRFKAETYTVLIVIAWTYLLHAYYREKKIEYRYYDKKTKRRRFSLTRGGAVKHWELSQCLDSEHCPLDSEVVQNLRFLVGLRNEIEHQMTSRIDDQLSARFQACCINFHDAMVKLHGAEFGIASHLSFSLQFASLSEEQTDFLGKHSELPGHIVKYIASFDDALTEQEMLSPKFAYRVFFVPKLVKKPGQADQVIEFVKADSEIAATVNKQYAVIKETEKPKWLAKEIVAKMISEGYAFNVYQHTQLWKREDAKKSQYGTLLGVSWFWYDAWVERVREHCRTCCPRSASQERGL